MSDKLVIFQCAPTLAGLKTGNMFSCTYESKQELWDEIRALNKRLVPKGLRALPLRYVNNRALIYVYRTKFLKRDLMEQAAVRLLESRGYPAMNPEGSLCYLIKRFQESEEFPHEVGVFLGYPPEDVCGFIENRACGHKCVGCWKVYGDEEKANRTFEQYKKCTQVYCSLLEQGKSMDRLIVAS